MQKKTKIIATCLAVAVATESIFIYNLTSHKQDNPYTTPRLEENNLQNSGINYKSDEGSAQKMMYQRSINFNSNSPPFRDDLFFEQ